jgi:hypothetical protein
MKRAEMNRLMVDSFLLFCHYFANIVLFCAIIAENASILEKCFIAMLY